MKTIDLNAKIESLIESMSALLGNRYSAELVVAEVYEQVMSGTFSFTNSECPSSREIVASELKAMLAK